MIPSRRADLYNPYLIELIARATIPRLCYQAAELAYTTYFTSDKKKQRKKLLFSQKAAFIIS